MRTMDDWELLRNYAKNRSEAAFAELVRRHLNWVYSAARRQVNDSLLAEEVAQSVFVLLAKKAGSLRLGTIVAGWLFRTTRFVAARAVRTEMRRRCREEAAVAMNVSTDVPDESEVIWNRLAPFLDQAVEALSESDRAAVLLRFYEKKSMQEVGRRLGVSEDAAKKRVSRALEKMRDFLIGRGVTLGSASLASVLATQAVQTAPAILAASIVKVSAGGAAGSVLPELARQTLNAWRWTKLKLAAGLIALSAACVFLAVEFRPPPISEKASRETTVAATETAPPNSQIAADRSLIERHDASSRSALPGSISGIVLGEQEQPISGAQVWAGSGYRPDVEAVTDTSGQFTLGKIGGRQTVTVLADGFAVDQQDVDTNNLPGQLVFHLSPARVLWFRVTDEAGQPIASADVALENWWGQRMSLEFRRRTDAQGRLAWASPPKGELEFCALKLGYRSSRGHKFTADGAEHRFVLHPVLTVAGRVTDADTGEPVASFKLTRGYSQLFSAQEETRPIWDLKDRWFGTNGSYKVIFDEENIPRLRVEAEGYDTVEAKPLTNALETVCDFQLHRSDPNRSIRGVVLLPDGTPASGVEVALCTFQIGVTLNGATFDARPHGNAIAEYRRTTDQQGLFSFSPKPGSHTVGAVCPVGVGKAHCFDWTQPIEIHLQAWGRIHGSVRTRDGQWANRKVVWWPLGNLHSGMDLFYDAVSTVSDGAGNFTLEMVPPGDGQGASRRC